MIKGKDLPTIYRVAYFIFFPLAMMSAGCISHKIQMSSTCGQIVEIPSDINISFYTPLFEASKNFKGTIFSTTDKPKYFYKVPSSYVSFQELRQNQTIMLPTKILFPNIGSAECDKIY